MRTTAGVSSVDMDGGDRWFVSMTAKGGERFKADVFRNKAAAEQPSRRPEARVPRLSRQAHAAGHCDAPTSRALRQIFNGRRLPIKWVAFQASAAYKRVILWRGVEQPGSSSGS